MDYAYTLNTENTEAITRYIDTYVPKPAVQEDPFLTLASNNTKTISYFISLVKDACNDFVTDVYDLIGDTYECCDSDSEYSDSESDSDSEYSDSESDSDSEYSDSYEHEETTGSISSTDDDSDISDSDDDNDELSRKIAANEFESIIFDFRCRLNSLEMRYFIAKKTFHNIISDEIEIFKTTTTKL